VTRVVAVVVTYNRRELLLEALAALRAQERAPDAVVVVDNASTDGSAAAVAAAYPQVRVHRMKRNTGGAGGFAVGLDQALAAGADVVWLMDDDTVPEPGALAALLEASAGYPGGEPALVASRVVWSDGRDHPMNTPRRKPFVRRAELRDATAIGCLPIRSASFVSILVSAAACRAAGPPIADYFLWNDDFEFTARLLRHGRGVQCPASVVVHKTRTFGGTDADPGERFFYEVRNKIWLLTRSRGLTPPERLIYTAASLRRWVRTFRGSRDRGTLWRALRRGLAAARRPPRPNEVALAEPATPV
jgi:GT2 family glycosyltransferase